MSSTAAATTRRCGVNPPASRGMVGGLAAVGLIVVGVFTGCASPEVGGRLALRSQSNPGAVLVGGFTTAWYRLDDKNNFTLVLLDGPEEEPNQAVIVRVFWKPRAGRTPIDATATNATIHYAIFTGDGRQEMGIYSGAGFVYPLDDPGADLFSADVWQATLDLSDRSAGFNDLLGRAVLEGQMTATRDDAGVSRVLRRLHVKVSDGMGYPSQVDAAPTRPAWGSFRLF